MSDSAPTAQVTAREIPVTIQGSQIVAGTDRRELFTETLKTVLVFDNGAAVNLKARVAPGQSLFLRNELSGREILCRVIEAPPVGQEGCTDLEFTIHDPDFWSVRYEENAAPADVAEASPQQQEQAPVAAAPLEAPAEAAQIAEAPSAPPPSEAVQEAGSPAIAGAAPEPESQGPSALPPPLSVSAGNEIPGFSELLARPQSHAPAESENMPQVDDAQDAERLAGIVAKYARALAKRASDKTAAKEAEQQTPAEGLPQDEMAAAPSRKQKAFSTLAFRLHAIRELTVKKNPIALAVVSCIVIGSALGVAWDVTGMLYPNRTPIIGAIRMKPVAPPAKPKVEASKTAPAKPAAAPSAAPATPTQTAKIQPPVVAQVPAARIEKTPTARATEVRPVRVSNAEKPGAILASSTGASGPVDSDLEAPGAERRRRLMGPQEVIPAKIVSQYQPSLPPWAKALDLQGTVKLDAVIDEKGNLRAMRVLSGPRALESAAEDAVGLWIFAPALSDGKPIPTHMLITVDFQR